MIKFSLKQDKLKQKIKKINILIKLLAENSFLIFLVLFLIGLFIGLIILYYYVFLPENQKIIIEPEKLFLFNQEKQNKILHEWENRMNIFNESDSMEIIDIFHRVD